MPNEQMIKYMALGNPNRSITSKIRANQMGEMLEYLIKDTFCNSFSVPMNRINEVYRNYFSLIGNQNNPPDFIIRNGDAVEVKKIGLSATNIALNSSPPKSHLMSNDSRILKSCRDCEGYSWEKKDIIYAVGYVSGTSINEITLVYGDCYAASNEVYGRISNAIKNIISNSGLELHETNELASIKKVDPLGITSLRVRGMWNIVEPIKGIPGMPQHRKEMSIIQALMRESKYLSLPTKQRKVIESSPKCSIIRKTFPEPDNPAKVYNGVIIRVKTSII